MYFFFCGSFESASSLSEHDLRHSNSPSIMWQYKWDLEYISQFLVALLPYSITILSWLYQRKIHGLIIWIEGKGKHAAGLFLRQILRVDWGWIELYKADISCKRIILTCSHCLRGQGYKTNYYLNCKEWKVLISSMFC